MSEFKFNSIKKLEDDTYHSESVGGVFGNELSASYQNKDAWIERTKELVAAKDDPNLVQSTKFREVAESGSYTKLQAACNIAYLMDVYGETAWLVPENVSEEEREKYWNDVWRWCSVSGDTSQKPKDWYTEE